MNAMNATDSTRGSQNNVRFDESVIPPLSSIHSAATERRPNEIADLPSRAFILPLNSDRGDPAVNPARPADGRKRWLGSSRCSNEAEKSHRTS